MAERSHQHHPFGQSHTRTRQASSSSSDQSSAPDDKSTLSIPRRRRPSPAQDKDQPPAAVASEPSRRRETKQTSSGPREKPSKGSSVNMTAPLDLPGEISYTPTTHRISKAKKGKKVHVCEFAGCNKVKRSSLGLQTCLTRGLGLHSSGASQVGHTSSTSTVATDSI